MTLYYRTKSKGKCGCGSWHEGVTTEYASKKELKARLSSSKKLEFCYTEEQFIEAFGEDNFKAFVNRAERY